MPTVTSNGVEVPFDARHFAALTDSTYRRRDPAALRERYGCDGYLFLRSVIEPERLRRLAADYFGAFDPSYLDGHHPPEAGIFSGHRPNDLPAHGTVGHPAHDFVRTAAFAELAHDPDLTDLATTVLDAPCRILPRKIVRHFDRSTRRASRAHSDHRYLNEGSDQLLTMWIPLTDTPLATGGLIYLEDSEDLDPSELDRLSQVSDRPNDQRSISHNLAWVAEQLGRRWLWADFRAGDIALHSPRVVHASLDTSTDAMRLSADLRFLVVGEEADPRWLQAWAGDDGY
ncbi:MAG: phytanoyl-CoA dioxygenase family protein [Actinomycetota bacterium]|nr:phytanoyl-CoA dioxygenase family protein [Actinomycetota bacterium]